LRWGKLRKTSCTRLRKVERRIGKRDSKKNIVTETSLVKIKTALSNMKKGILTQLLETKRFGKKKRDKPLDGTQKKREKASEGWGALGKGTFLTTRWLSAEGEPLTGPKERCRSPSTNS